MLCTDQFNLPIQATITRGRSLPWERPGIYTYYNSWMSAFLYIFYDNGVRFKIYSMCTINYALINFET